jgi:hypothetical protein
VAARLGASMSEKSSESLRFSALIALNPIALNQCPRMAARFGASMVPRILIQCYRIERYQSTESEGGGGWRHGSAPQCPRNCGLWIQCFDILWPAGPARGPARFASRRPQFTNKETVIA